MEQKERDFKGVWIPKELYLDTNLSWAEKILLIEIHSLDRGEGCYASNQYLAEFVQCTEKSLANMLTKLRKLQYLTTVKFDGRKRWIRATHPSLMKADFISEGKQTSQNYEGCLHKNMNILNKYSNEGDKKSPLVSNRCAHTDIPPKVKKDKRADLTEIPEKLKEKKGFAETWDSWLKYRKEIKHKIMPTTAKKQLKFLEQQPDPIACIEQSIRNGWRGLFPLKDNNGCGYSDDEWRQNMLKRIREEQNQ